MTDAAEGHEPEHLHELHVAADDVTVDGDGREPACAAWGVYVHRDALAT